jgi:hypothetical protein
MNQLILGDNLEIMRKMEAETIDLIYLNTMLYPYINSKLIPDDKNESL